MKPLREFRGLEDLVALMAEQGLDLAPLRFKFMYVVVPFARSVAIPLRLAPWWPNLGAMALLFTPITLWGIAAQRFSSVRLTGEGIQSDEGLAARKDLRLAGDGASSRRAPGRPLFAMRILQLQSGRKAPRLPGQRADAAAQATRSARLRSLSARGGRRQDRKALLASAGGSPADHPRRL